MKHLFPKLFGLAVLIGIVVACGGTQTATVSPTATPTVVVTEVPTDTPTPIPVTPAATEDAQTGAQCGSPVTKTSNPITVICPRHTYTAHLSSRTPPDVTVDNCTLTNRNTLTSGIDIHYFSCASDPGTLTSAWNPTCSNVSFTEFPVKKDTISVEISLVC
jgi:hypothetical protein